MKHLLGDAKHLLLQPRNNLCCSVSLPRLGLASGYHIKEAAPPPAGLPATLGGQPYTQQWPEQCPDPLRQCQHPTSAGGGSQTLRLQLACSPQSSVH